MLVRMIHQVSLAAWVRSFYLMLTETIVIAVAAGIIFLWVKQKINNSTNTSASTPPQNDRVPTMSTDLQILYHLMREHHHRMTLV